MNVLTVTGLAKSYSDGAAAVGVLSNLDFELSAGELVGVWGASGSGKSTFLHLLGGLDQPDAGQVFYRDQDISRMNDATLSNIRNRSFGFVFQFFYLMPELTAVENVMLPGLIAGTPRPQLRQKALELLETMGLSERAQHRPSQLSGGEQQRVCIARAVINEPEVLLADEPTGSLDAYNGSLAWKLLLQLHRERNMAMVVVTHNQDLLSGIPRVFRLHDGKLHMTSQNGGEVVTQ